MKKFTTLGTKSYPTNGKVEGKERFPTKDQELEYLQISHGIPEVRQWRNSFRVLRENCFQQRVRPSVTKWIKYEDRKRTFQTFKIQKVYPMLLFSEFTGGCTLQKRGHPPRIKSTWEQEIEHPGQDLRIPEKGEIGNPKTVSSPAAWQV